MPDIDFFNFFRYLLGVVVTIYASIVTWQSLREWWAYLNGDDRYVSMLRRYLLVHGLRMRFRTFWGDVIVCGLLCVVFGLIWRAHNIIYGIGEVLHSAR